MQEKKYKTLLISNLKKYPLLQEYIKIVSQWSTKMNLLSKEDSNNFNLIWERHVYNSYILKSYIDQYPINQKGFKTILDLGSGAGFPGLVLAILDNSANHYYLVEKNHKKSSFLIFTKNSLQLNNVTILNKYINDLEENIADVVISRGLTNLTTLAFYAQKLLKPKGCAFFLKGESYAKEIEEMKKNFPSEVFTTKIHQSLGDVTTTIQLTKI